MAIVGLLVLGLLATEARGAATPNLSPNGDRFEVLSNKLLANSRQFGPGIINNSLGQPAGEAEAQAPVWAKSCADGKQTVALRRTVDLLGVPGEVELTVNQLLGTAWVGKSPLRSFKFLVNNTVVGSGPILSPGNAARPVITTKKKAAFRDGKNIIELRVVKAASPKKVKRCNANEAKRLAVVFRLAGTVSADLSFAEVPAKVYYKAGDLNVPQIGVRLNNEGPSGILSGSFVITVVGAENVVVLGSEGNPGVGFKPLAPPIDGCQVTGGNNQFTITCLLSRFKASTTAKLEFTFNRHFESRDFTEASSFLSWQANSSAADPDRSDNSRQTQVVFCGTKATSEGCASAT